MSEKESGVSPVTADGPKNPQCILHCGFERKSGGASLHAAIVKVASLKLSFDVHGIASESSSLARFGDQGVRVRHIGLLQIVIMRLRQPAASSPLLAPDSDIQGFKNYVIGLGRTESHVQ